MSSPTLSEPGPSRSPVDKTSNASAEWRHCTPPGATQIHVSSWPLMGKQRRAKWDPGAFQSYVVHWVYGCAAYVSCISQSIHVCVCVCVCIPFVLFYVHMVASAVFSSQLHRGLFKPCPPPLPPGSQTVTCQHAKTIFRGVD